MFENLGTVSGTVSVVVIILSICMALVAGHAERNGV